MNRDPLNDAKILASWGRNALPWTVAVREKRIESRHRVTDRAIVEATLSRAPHSTSAAAKAGLYVNSPGTTSGEQA